MTTLKWNGYCDLAVNFASGCSNDLPCRPTCWARKMATRQAAMEKARKAMLLGVAQNEPFEPYPYLRQLERRGDPFWPALHLDVMARWDRKLASMKKPRRIALNFMSDIGSDGSWDIYREIGWTGIAARKAVQEHVRDFCSRHPRHTFLVLTKRPEALISPWPANVHVGVSASGADEAAPRLEALYRVECGLRWASFEPWDDTKIVNGAFPWLGWLVIGGWSGKRPLRAEVVASAKSIVRACKALGVPVFVKDNMRDNEYSGKTCASGQWETDWPQEIPT